MLRAGTSRERSHGMRSRWIELLGVGIALGASLLAAPGGAAEPTPRRSLRIVSKTRHTLAIVDPATLRVIARAPVGEDPHEVVASSDIGLRRRQAGVHGPGSEGGWTYGGDASTTRSSEDSSPLRESGMLQELLVDDLCHRHPRALAVMGGEIDLVTDGELHAGPQ